MSDSSIGIQAISPFSGTSQGRNEAFRDQSAQTAAQLARQQEQQRDEPEQSSSSGESAHQLDVTV